MENYPLKKISDYQLPTPKNTRATERGDLLKYFAERMAMTIPRVARHLAHLTKLEDLYYLKSDCEQATTRGVPFGAAFWTAIKPK